MKPILQILKLDYKSYDDYRFSCFFSWCSLYSELLPLQALATSKHLYEWYCTQWRGVVENAFINDNKSFIDANINAPHKYLDLLALYPKAIEGYYPSIIFEMITNELRNIQSPKVITKNQ